MLGGRFNRSFTPFKVQSYNPSYKSYSYDEDPAQGSSNYNFGGMYEEHLKLKDKLEKELGTATYSNPMIPENNPQGVVDNYRKRLDNTNYLDMKNDRFTVKSPEIPDRKPEGLGNALMTVLDVLQRPQYMVTNPIKRLTDDKKDSVGDIVGSIGRGFTGAEKSSTTDIFDNAGWHNDDTKKWYQSPQNTARNVAGFIGDVLLDPTTYLTMGGSSVAKAGAKSATKKALAEEVAKGTAKGVVKESPTRVAFKLAEALHTTPEKILEQASKHGTDSEMVLKLASALGDTEKLGTANSDVAKRILDGGLDYVNNNMIKTYTEGLEKSKSFVKTAQDKAIERRQGSMGSLFGGSLSSGTFDVNKMLKSPDTFATGKDIVDNMIDVFDPNVLKTYTTQDKSNILKKIFDADFDDTIIDAYSDQEVGVLDTLLKSFGTTGEGVKGADDILSVKDKIMGSMKLASGDFKNVENLRGFVHEEGKLMGSIKKIDGGIEFANGIQRVYNKGVKRFELKFNNPFTGKVTPILDMTDAKNAITSPIKQTASEVVTGFKPFRTVADVIDSAFNTEHVSLKLKQFKDDAGKAIVWDAAKQAAATVTDALHKETGVNAQALRAATGMFERTDKILKDPKLQQSAITYLQRNEDTASKIAWELISSDKPIDNVIQELVDTAESIEDVTHIQEVADFMKRNGALEHYAKLKLKPEDVSYLETKVAPRVQQFNEAVLKRDELDGLAFTDGTAQLIDADKTATYVHQAYKSDPDEVRLMMNNTSSVQKTHKRTASKAGFEKQRRFSSVAMQRAYAPDMKPIDNLIVSMALREQESLKIKINKHLYDSLYDSVDKIPGMNELLSKADPKNGAMTEIYRRGDRVLYGNPDIVHQLNRVTKSFNTDEGIAKMLEWYDGTTNILKTLQTAANPNFLFRNLIGEPMMNWFAGVDMKSQLKGMEIMQELKKGSDISTVGNTTFLKGQPIYRKTKADFGKGLEDAVEEINLQSADKSWKSATLKPTRSVAGEASIKSDIYKNTKSKTFEVGGKTYTAEELMKIYENVGLGWSGVTKGNLIQKTQSTIKNAIYAKSGNKAQQGIEAIRDMGDSVETWTRFSQFIDRLDKGMDFKSAAADVRAYHVDYRDLTNVERNILRRVMPYYTYMRKNLPIQMNMILSHSNKANMINHLIDSSYEALERDNGGEVATEDYLKEGMALPLSVDDAGNVRYLNWNLPLSDVSRLQYDFGDFMEKNVVDMITPIGRTPLELVLNKNTRYDTEIEKYAGETAPLFPTQGGTDALGIPQIPKAVDYTLQQLGVVQSARKGIGQLSDVLNKVPENPLKPYNTAMLGSVLPLKNQQNTRNNQAYDYRDQLADYLKQLEAQGISVPTIKEIDEANKDTIGKTKKNMPRIMFPGKYTP